MNKDYRLRFYIMLSLALLGSSFIIEYSQQMAGFGSINLWAILMTTVGFIMVGICGPLAYYFYSRSRRPAVQDQIEAIAKAQAQKDKSRGDRS